MSSRFTFAAAIQLLGSVVLLAAVTQGRAADITYNLVDYPLNETDQFNSAQDTLSGTIVTDGTLGVLSATDIVGGSWTVSNSISGSVTYPITISSSIIATDLNATATALTLSVSGGLLIPNTAGPTQLGYAYHDSGISPSYGYAAGNNSTGPFFVDLSPSALAGSIGANRPLGHRHRSRTHLAHAHVPGTAGTRSSLSAAS